MDINIKTLADGCRVTVNIKVQGQTLLNLTDNDEGSVNLFSGITYRFEWFVITARDAHIKIEAAVTPDNDGFHPDYHWIKRSALLIQKRCRFLSQE